MKRGRHPKGSFQTSEQLKRKPFENGNMQRWVEYCTQVKVKVLLEIFTKVKLSE